MKREERLAALQPLLREVLELLGEDPEREGLRRTPERWAEALLAYTEGANGDPEEHLRVTFHLDEDDYYQMSDDMIIVENIDFASTCEHHIAPFRGVVHIAYIPNPHSRVISGLSKLTRVVDLYSQRLQLQERMTHQIAQAIDKHLDPLGVITVVQAVHYCMIQRGVKQRSSSTITTARYGIFRDNPALETRFQEYLRLRLNTSQW
ncbi:MAG: GTP cyclohydrolase I FolE [Chloroflexi bacterium]|nr:GTP cyclohydrolase I FolE [Chloroflexota bacterium]